MTESVPSSANVGATIGRPLFLNSADVQCTPLHNARRGRRPRRPVRNPFVGDGPHVLPISAHCRGVHCTSGRERGFLAKRIFSKRTTDGRPYDYSRNACGGRTPGCPVKYRRGGVVSLPSAARRCKKIRPEAPGGFDVCLAGKPYQDSMLWNSSM